ncbi:hypothetical protein, partial [Streptomyces puniciscabiei]|uniref:hypothetical protein n=1 Tax=Streptomyces puniciscabiei TaxID=164348 RepID=UPI003EBE1720
LIRTVRPLERDGPPATALADSRGDSRMPGADATGTTAAAAATRQARLANATMSLLPHIFVRKPLDGMSPLPTAPPVPLLPFNESAAMTIQHADHL